jgi:surface antigen
MEEKTYVSIVSDYNMKKLALMRKQEQELLEVSPSNRGSQGYISSRNVTVLASNPNIPLKEGSHTFYAGNCTRFVASQYTIPWGGDAEDWIYNAPEYGYEIKDVPDEGDIFVTDESGYGHVGIVKEVDYESGTITVEEMNYKGYGVISEREISLDSTRLQGFIDPDKEEVVVTENDAVETSDGQSSENKTQNEE